MKLSPQSLRGGGSYEATRERGSYFIILFRVNKVFTFYHIIEAM